MAFKSNEAGAIELIRIAIADMQFGARLEWKLAPKTCAAFVAALPFRGKLLQARWSGEAAWIPLADFDLGVGVENATGTPCAGEILFHPADHSECEILIPYGKCVFRCKDGELTGNRFLTIVEGKENLAKVGELVLQSGSQEITFSRC
jgi:Protein of unknown function (DUF3830)